MPERRFGFYYTLGKFDENFNKKTISVTVTAFL